MATATKKAKQAEKSDAPAPQGIWENRAWPQTAANTPDDLKGQTLQTRILRRTNDPEEAVRRGLIAAGAPETVSVSVDGLPEEMGQTVAHAIIDALNDQGIALTRQKRLNTAKTGFYNIAADKREEAFGHAEVTLQAAQEIVDADPVLTPKQKMVGGPSVKKQRIEKGRRLEEAATSGQLSEAALKELRELGLA